MDKKEQKYRDDLKRINDANKVVKKRVTTAHLSFQDSVDKFNGRVNPSINWVDLRVFPLNEWVEIFPGVYSLKYHQDTHALKFRTIMKPNTAFKWHKHKDCKELVEVLKGELYEAITETSYGEGESVFYPSGFEHIPTNVANVDNLLDITFIYEG
jgi:mannose-6-phosphate isomerase-like protein (cupin superfamily)